MWLPRLLTRKAAAPGTPPGQRIYAIGDIHGRLDLLKQLFAMIEAEIPLLKPAKTTLIILGDFIDRGPDSARLLSALAHYQRSKRLIVLKGNHEAAMLDAIRGDFDAMDLWLAHGGDATLRSFGVAADEIDPEDTAGMISIVRDAIPQDLVEWLSALPTFYRSGSYYFVHAGIRPGVPLAKQKEHDLLWIRDAFIESDEDHGAIIVYGHTVYEEGVQFAANRIGIDTGAYRTGMLSAVGLQGLDQWALTTQPIQ